MKTKTQQPTLAQKKSALTGFLLALPALAIFLLMIVYPFANSIWYSFTSKSLIYPNPEFIGLSNYIKIFSTSYLWDLLGSTATFVIFATLCPFTIGLIWAVLMNQKFKGSEFLRGVTLVNWIIPGIAISFLWSWIFNGDYGILNALLIRIGILSDNVVWLGTTKTAMFTVVTARTWQMFPWYMSFILGGLQGVPGDQLEATRIDGANNWQNFIYIILPSVAPILQLILIMGLIGNLQHFDLINVMTSGGPEGSTSTFATEVYRIAFSEYDIGKAAALGTIWAVVLSMFSFVYLKRIKEDD